MKHPLRWWLAACTLAGLVCCPSAADAQAPPTTAVPHGTGPGGTIDPPPPLAPAELARNAAGQVTLRAVRITRPLVIDGQLDEDLYRSVQPIDGFIQTNPSPGSPASEGTEVWIAYDSERIYVGAKCYDSAPEDKWVANEMRRDNRNVIRNENFAIYFDTFLDRRNAFLFELTPIGGVYDATVTNEQPGGNIDYNPVWTGRSGRFPGGWTVEMSIPFRILRYRPGNNQVWGVNIRRTVRWKNEESFVNRMPPNEGSVIFQISKGGTLVGIDTPPGRHNIELKPYGIAGTRSDLRANPPVKQDGNADYGVDVKYGVTQNLTADFTYNTDFAQVEVDEQQVNLTRFPLFFPEKREFFLEGQGIFDFGGGVSTASNSSSTGLTPLLFFSRRIGLNNGRTIPIDVGGRLTGKVGKTSVGIIDVKSGTATSTPSTNFAVVRVKRDIFRRSSVGLLATTRSVSADGRDAAQAYGADVSIGLYDNITFNGYVAQTQNPGGSGDDTSYRAQVNYNGDRYGMQFERLAVDSRFDPQVGFLRRSAFTRSYGQFRFSPRPRRRSRRIRKYSYLFNYDYITSPAGRLETRDVNAQFGIQFQNSDQFTVQTGRSFEGLTQPFAIATGVRIPVGGYGFQDGSVAWAFGNQHKISGTVTAVAGQFYDGDRLSLTYSSGRVELSPRVSIEPGVTYNRVHLPAGDFTTRLISSRATFTVTPRMFFTGLLQFNSSTRAVSSNLRLRWEYRPGSELFVVYTDERDTQTRGIPDLRNRAFVVKMNRLLLF